MTVKSSHVQIIFTTYELEVVFFFFFPPKRINLPYKLIKPRNLAKKIKIKGKQLTEMAEKIKLKRGERAASAPFIAAACSLILTDGQGSAVQQMKPRVLFSKTHSIKTI